MNRHRSDSRFSASRNRANDEKGLLSQAHCLGELGLQRPIRKVLFAGVEAQEGTSLAGAVITNGATQDGKAQFERVKHARDGQWFFWLELYLSAHLGKGSQVLGQHHAYQGKLQLG